MVSYQRQNPSVLRPQLEQRPRARMGLDTLRCGEARTHEKLGRCPRSRASCRHITAAAVGDNCTQSCVVLARVWGPFPSCRGPLAATKIGALYRSDGVTWDWSCSVILKSVPRKGSLALQCQLQLKTCTLLALSALSHVGAH